MSYTLERANDGQKKFVVTTPSGKRIKFGQEGAPDYTLHDAFEAEAKRRNYISRHAGNADGQTSRRERWDDPSSPGFWSRWLLWEKRSLQDAIRNIERKFGIRIDYQGIPSRNTTPPIRNRRSPPKRSTSPPKRYTSPPQRNRSPPKRSTSPPRRNRSPPKRSTSPPLTRRRYE